MKKCMYVLLFALLCFSLLATACGRSSSDNGDITTYDTPTEVAKEPPEPYVETTTAIDIADLYRVFTTEQYLEDLAYMLYVMQNNFALFDVAYWARGVDIYAIFDEIEEAVLANPIMTVDEFFDVVLYQFEPLRTIGHFRIIEPDWRNFLLYEPAGTFWRLFYSFSALNRLRQPHVAAFYDTAFEMMEPFNWAVYLTQAGRTEQELRAHRRYIQLVARGETELAENFVQVMLAGDVSEALRLQPYIEAATSNNVTMRILEEDRIAFLAVDSFMGYPVPAHEERLIHGFYEEIRDFEHLIIDIRGNGGGAAQWFHRMILEPNIDSTFVMEGFSFLSFGAYASYRQYSHVSIGQHIAPNTSPGVPRSMDRSWRPVAELIEAFDLPDLNLSDMERMDYGIRIQTTVEPRAHYPRMCLEPTFQGKIWLLTSPFVGSAAELSAWATRETGFATIVGEVTGGAFGGQSTIITLPNSGIAFSMDLNYVTDRYGRPLEAGTIPDIFNHDGMDALQTVLALIAAGEYE